MMKRCVSQKLLQVLCSAACSPQLRKAYEEKKDEEGEEEAVYIPRAMANASWLSRAAFLSTISLALACAAFLSTCRTGFRVA